MKLSAGLLSLVCFIYVFKLTADNLYETNDKLKTIVNYINNAININNKVTKSHQENDILNEFNDCIQNINDNTVIEYDMIRKYIIIRNEFGIAINKYNNLQSKSNITVKSIYIYESNYDSVEQVNNLLVYDWVHSLIFYNDFGDIRVMNTNGKIHYYLFSINNLKSLVVDPKQLLLIYLQCISTYGIISQSEYDGENKQIIKFLDTCPQSIIFNYYSRRVYWYNNADESLHSLYIDEFKSIDDPLNDYQVYENSSEHKPNVNISCVNIVSTNKLYLTTDRLDIVISSDKIQKFRYAKIMNTAYQQSNELLNYCGNCSAIKGIDLCLPFINNSYRMCRQLYRWQGVVVKRVIETKLLQTNFTSTNGYAKKFVEYKIEILWVFIAIAIIVLLKRILNN